MKIKYHIKKQELVFSIFGIVIKRFKAISGPYGKGSAPVGEYSVALPLVIDERVEKNKPYTVNGFAFWCLLVPRFKTDRSGIGIHPDGNVKGTLGCIGIDSEEDQYLVFSLLRVFHYFSTELFLIIKK